MLGTYILYVYTDWVPDETTRYFVGWVNIGVIALIVINNLLLVIIQTGFQICFKIKAFRHKRRLRLYRKKIEQNKLEAERERIEEE